MKKETKPSEPMKIINSSVVGEEIAYKSADCFVPLDSDGRYQGLVVYRESEMQEIRRTPITPEEVRLLHDAKRIFNGQVITSRPAYNTALLKNPDDNSHIPAERDVPEEYRQIYDLAQENKLPASCNCRVSPCIAVHNANKYMIKVFQRPENEQDNEILRAIKDAYQNAALSMAQIDTGYAFFPVMITDGKITDAPPIAVWTIGKNWEDVKEYYSVKKKARVAEVYG